MIRPMFAAMALMISSAAIAQTAHRAPGTGATVPQGATVNVQPTEATVSTPTAGAGELPRCSRTVTHRCIQIENGRGRKMSRRKHRSRRHRR